MANRSPSKIPCRDENDIDKIEIIDASTEHKPSEPGASEEIAATKLPVVQVMRQEEVEYELEAFPKDNDVVLPKEAPNVKRKNKNETFENKEKSNKRIRLLRKENKEMEQKLKCIMCEESDVNVVVLPCCHFRICKGCSEDIKVCPACGTDVKYKFSAIL